MALINQAKLFPARGQGWRRISVDEDCQASAMLPLESMGGSVVVDLYVSVVNVDFVEWSPKIVTMHHTQNVCAGELSVVRLFIVFIFSIFECAHRFLSSGHPPIAVHSPARVNLSAGVHRPPVVQPSFDLPAGGGG
nr:probable magnesium transporter NIPA8 [Ipomoea batatas]